MCQALELKPDMRVLRSAAAGAVSPSAARDYGARVTAITLSPAQLAYAQAR